MAQYELIQYTLNPLSETPQVYIGLYLLGEGKPSKSRLTAEQVIRNGQRQSGPSGNQTRFDIASGRAQDVRVSQLSVFEASSPEMANKAKMEAIKAVDTARFELLNSAMSGARNSTVLRDQYAKDLWEFHQSNPGYIRNSGSALKHAVIDLMMEGYPLLDAIAEADSALD